MAWAPAGVPGILMKRFGRPSCWVFFSGSVLALSCTTAQAQNLPARVGVASRVQALEQQLNVQGAQLQAFAAPQPLEQRQRYEGIEAKSHLGAARVFTRIDVLAQPRQVRQAVSHRDTRQSQQQAGTDQTGRRANVQRAFKNRLEQQNWKQQVIHQTLNLRPHRAVERGVPADQKARKNEREVRKKKLGVIHPFENNRKKSGFALMRNPREAGAAPAATIPAVFIARKPLCKAAF